jgi:NitT/TauT family transport system permease protein
MNAKTIIYPLGSMTALILIWQAAATGADSLALPGPWVVGQVLYRETVSGQLPLHLGITLARLVASFAVAMIVGAGFGIVLGRHPTLDRMLDPWLVTFLNIPALVIIILCYVWFGLGELAAIGAVVINKVPNVIVIVREGTRALDKDLLEMADAYRFGPFKTLRHVIWPQLYPYLISAARNGLALIWKIILVVELLGRSNGMGYQLHLYFQMFNVAGILAYTVAFVAIVQLLELLLVKPLETRATQWRR